MNLKYISDKKLLNEISRLVQHEREILGQVLWHLKEIDQRKLYADLKCKSLFDYCVKNLKYSEGQASRRVSACRLLKELPELDKAIISGDLNLTQLNLVKNFFSDEKITDKDLKTEVIDKIAGKTTRKTEEILWDLKKEPTPRKVLVSLNEETLDKIKHVKGMKAHVHRDLDAFLMKAMNDLENFWAPKNIKGRKSTSDTRYIPTMVKEHVWRRDKGQCVNCHSTQNLQFDHIKPFSMGGKTDIENLQLLCSNCNQRRGYMHFGDKRGTTRYSQSS